MVDAGSIRGAGARSVSETGPRLDPILRLATLLEEATRFRRIREATPSPTRCVMLPPFIIDQIRRREEEERRSQLERPVLELPLERAPLPQAPRPRRDDEEVTERGVVIFDLV